MASFLSMFGNGLTSIHMFSKLYKLPEFREFMKIMNDNMSTDIITQFLRNLICTIMDPIVENVLMNKENNLIFLNESIDKETQVKLFVGKIFNELYGNESILPDFVQLDMTKEELISYFILVINDVKGLENATNGRDVYTLIVNYYASTLATFIEQIMSEMLCEEKENSDLLETVNTLLKKFNEIYHYESENICEDMLDSDYSYHSESDSESDSNNTSNDKKRKLDTATPLDSSFDAPTKKSKKN